MKPTMANTTRIETTLPPDDAELLARVAKSRNTTVAELVRNAIYAQIEPMKRAADERNARIYREVEERRKLREWQGLPR